MAREIHVPGFDIRHEFGSDLATATVQLNPDGSISEDKQALLARIGTKPNRLFSVVITTLNPHEPDKPATTEFVSTYVDQLVPAGIPLNALVALESAIGTVRDSNEGEVFVSAKVDIVRRDGTRFPTGKELKRRRRLREQEKLQEQSDSAS